MLINKQRSRDINRKRPPSPLLLLGRRKKRKRKGKIR